ncbi:MULTISPECIES: nucleoside-diphosphate kinase [Pelosinus]|uniref:Nucleoside diphosphate kinase n=1 Tax=Pelosinus fermentans B4 TaxID=1149862 RepID=I9LCC3_9FIRM|nr:MULTISPECIES: nucleoside-diphosphate kinase [Pelosinus]EIW18079.1 nucleoside diphosphate kinase [Pelosinus fermentans B4]EIW24117.1 Nucleoside diphosphate kinase [Pelosinus fermentans A11]OAM94188.1 Nucleoside diphosphate kinase [Pelosinus fermentans DSM 17108]SDR02489.1 nucleoside diphosphate kinase [Pelosinus fermentans]
MEKTLLLLKPDAVVKGVCGQIIDRFEKRGFEIAAIKMVQLTRKQAEIHYYEHTDKPFFQELVDFITSSPLIAMVIAGENAIKVSRIMMGSTNPIDAAAGTIRGDFALNIRKNIIHGSDSLISAEREIKNFFTEKELYL